jgi:hypothetical protein
MERVEVALLRAERQAQQVHPVRRLIEHGIEAREAREQEPLVPQQHRAPRRRQARHGEGSPSAMQSTFTATTDANVNSDAPSESAPRRFRIVWIVIIAKPTSRPTVAQAMPPVARRVGSPRASDGTAPRAAARTKERSGGEVDRAHRDHHAREAEPRDQHEAGRQRADRGADAC